MLNGRPRLQRWCKLKACGNKKKLLHYPQHQCDGLIAKEGEQAQLRQASKPAWDGLTISTERKQWVTVVEDSLLQGMEAPMVHLGSLSWEIWCLQRGKFRMLLLKLIWPLEPTLAAHPHEQ